MPNTYPEFPMADTPNPSEWKHADIAKYYAEQANNSAVIAENYEKQLEENIDVVNEHVDQLNEHVDEISREIDSKANAASASATAAANSASAAATSATSAAETVDTVAQYAEDAEAAKDAAETAQAYAEQAADTTAGYVSSASASATAAASSATSAATSASHVDDVADNVQEVYETVQEIKDEVDATASDIETHIGEAETAATNASLSATAAATSASNASLKATSAATSATAASASADRAEQYARSIDLDRGDEDIPETIPENGIGDNYRDIITLKHDVDSFKDHRVRVHINLPYYDEDDPIVPDTIGSLGANICPNSVETYGDLLFSEKTGPVDASGITPGTNSNIWYDISPIIVNNFDGNRDLFRMRCTYASYAGGETSSKVNITTGAFGGLTDHDGILATHRYGFYKRPARMVNLNYTDVEDADNYKDILAANFISFVDNTGYTEMYEDPATANGTKSAHIARPFGVDTFNANNVLRTTGRLHTGWASYMVIGGTLSENSSYSRYFPSCYPKYTSSTSIDSSCGLAGQIVPFVQTLVPAQPELYKDLDGYYDFISNTNNWHTLNDPDDRTMALTGGMYSLYPYYSNNVDYFIGAVDSVAARRDLISSGHLSSQPSTYSNVYNKYTTATPYKLRSTLNTSLNKSLLAGSNYYSPIVIGNDDFSKTSYYSVLGYMQDICICDLYEPNYYTEACSYGKNLKFIHEGKRVPFNENYKYYKQSYGQSPYVLGIHYFDAEAQEYRVFSPGDNCSYDLYGGKWNYKKYLWVDLHKPVTYVVGGSNSYNRYSDYKDNTSSSFPFTYTYDSSTTYTSRNTPYNLEFYEQQGEFDPEQLPNIYFGNAPSDPEEMAKGAMYHDDPIHVVTPNFDNRSTVYDRIWNKMVMLTVDYSSSPLGANDTLYCADSSYGAEDDLTIYSNKKYIENDTEFLNTMPDICKVSCVVCTPSGFTVTDKTPSQYGVYKNYLNAENPGEIPTVALNSVKLFGHTAYHIRIGLESPYMNT